MGHVVGLEVLDRIQVKALVSFSEAQDEDRTILILNYQKRSVGAAVHRYLRATGQRVSGDEIESIVLE